MIIIASNISHVYKYNIYKFLFKFRVYFGKINKSMKKNADVYARYSFEV